MENKMKKSQLLALKLTKKQEEKLRELVIFFFKKEGNDEDNCSFIDSVDAGTVGLDFKIVGFDHVTKRDKVGDIKDMDTIFELPWYEFCMRILPVIIISKLDLSNHYDISDAFGFNVREKSQFFKDPIAKIIVMLFKSTEHPVDYLYDFVELCKKNKLFKK